MWSSSGSSARDPIQCRWHAEENSAVKAAGLVLYRIDRGTGGWRIFPANGPVGEMVSGTATPVLEGFSNFLPLGPSKWESPTNADIERATVLLRQLRRARQAEAVGQ